MLSFLASYTSCASCRFFSLSRFFLSLSRFLLCVCIFPVQCQQEAVPGVCSAGFSPSRSQREASPARESFSPRKIKQVWCHAGSLAARYCHGITYRHYFMKGNLPDWHTNVVLCLYSYKNVSFMVAESNSQFRIPEIPKSASSRVTRAAGSDFQISICQKLRCPGRLEQQGQSSRVRAAGSDFQISICQKLRCPGRLEQQGQTFKFQFARS